MDTDGLGRPETFDGDWNLVTCRATTKLKHRVVCGGGILATMLALPALLFAQSTYSLAPLPPEVTDVTNGAIGAPFFTYTQTPSPGSLAIQVTTNNNVNGSGTITVAAPGSI